MAKFKMGVLVPAGSTVTARLGSAADAGGRVTDAEKGKFVKLAGDSQYDAVAVTTPIEGVMTALEPATVDGWSSGSVMKNGRVSCVCDGIEGTPGTGTVAVGDLVVAGTVVAKGTALTTGPKVCSATSQAAVLHNWRVVSIGDAGAVCDTCIIERV